MAAGYSNTFYIRSATYLVGATTHTYSCTAGAAPMSFSYDWGGNPAGERVADNLYPTNQTIIDPSAGASLNLADVKPTSLPALGDVGTLTFTLPIDAGGSTETVVMYRMVFQGLSGQQNRAQAGGASLNFVYEDGCTSKSPFTA